MGSVQWPTSRVCFGRFEIAGDLFVLDDHAELHRRRIKRRDGDGAGFVVFLAAHDDGELAIDHFLADFHHVPLIVEPYEIDLFVFRARVVGDRGGDFERLALRVGDIAEEDIFASLAGPHMLPGWMCTSRPFLAMRQYVWDLRSQVPAVGELGFKAVLENEVGIVLGLGGGEQDEAEEQREDGEVGGGHGLESMALRPVDANRNKLNRSWYNARV